MSNRWKLRPDFFNGASTYTIKLKTDDGTEQTVSFEVDRNGCFTLPGPVNFPLGVYAKAV
jgi:hypothetical protein